MAYTFNGTTQYLVAAGRATALISAYPFTIFARARSTNTASNQIVMTLIQSTGPFSGMAIYMAGGVVGDPALWSHAGASSASAGTYSSGVWYALTGSGIDNSNGAIALDNTRGTGTNGLFLSGTLDINLAARLIPSITQPLTGSLCCAALWDVELTAADIAQLVAGFSPRRVRPDRLKEYSPLVRDLIHWVCDASGAPGSWSATGSPTVSAHPRSYGF